MHSRFLVKVQGSPANMPEYDVKSVINAFTFRGRIDKRSSVDGFINDLGSRANSSFEKGFYQLERKSRITYIPHYIQCWLEHILKEIRFGAF